MAVDYQAIEFDLSSPLDESVDSAAHENALTVAHNVAYDRIGALIKRPGVDALTATATLTAVRRLIPVGADVCAAGSSSAENNFAQYLASQSDWVRSDTLSEAVITRRTIARDLAESLVDADMGITANWLIYAWTRVRSGPAYDVWIKIVDRTTGAVSTYAQLATGVRSPRVAVTPDQLAAVVTYLDVGATTLKGHTINSAGAISAATNLDIIAKSSIYDFFASDNAGFHYIGIDTADDITYKHFTTGLAANISWSIAGTFRRPSAIILPNTHVAIAYWDVGASELRVIERTATGAAVVGPVTLDATGTEYVSQAGMVYDGSKVLITWALDNVDTLGTDCVFFRTWTPGSSTVGTTTNLYRYRLASRMFSDATSGRTRLYQWLWDDNASVLVLTAFIVSTLEWRPVATAAFGLAKATADNLKNITIGATGEYRCGLVTGVLAQESLSAVDDVAAEFSDRDLFSSAVFGKMTYVGGGILQQVSGSFIDEHAFIQLPKITVADAAGTNLTAAKTYSWAVVYSYEDDFGNLHQSTPVFASLTAVDHGGGQGGATVTVWPLTMTRRQRSSRTTPKVLISVYREQTDAPGIWLRLTSYTLTPDAQENNVTVIAPITFTDNYTDGAIGANERLYTTGGQLERDAVWGGARGLCIHKSRMFAWGGENREVIWYSQEAVNAEPPEFNLAQQIRVPGETVVACASLDDALIVFTQQKIFAVFGDGPNALGDPASGSFSIPVPIASDTGAVSSRTCTTGKGVYFQGRNGINLIDRSRTIVFIGQSVLQSLGSGTSALTLLDAVHVPSRSEVRFIFSTTAAIYDERANRWMTWHWGQLAITAVESAMVLDGRFFLTVAGNLYRESESTHTDQKLGVAGADIVPAIDVQTIELDFGSAQLQKRCRWMREMLYVEPNGNTGAFSGLTVSYFRDGSAHRLQQATETFVLSSSDVAFKYAHSTETFPALGFRHKPAKQKFQRVSVRLTETDPVDPGLTFVGLGFEIGAEGGLRRTEPT